MRRRARSLLLALVVSAPATAAALPSPGEVRAAYPASEAQLLDRHGVVLDSRRQNAEVRRSDWVPLSALSAEKDQPYVWVVDTETSTLKRTDVRIGAYGEKTVPILEGLQASDWVVAAGGQVLREGQQVRPVDRDNRVVQLTAKAKPTVEE